MKKEYLILTGSHYDINYQIGQMFKKDVQKYVKAINVAGNIDLLNNCLNFFKTHYPNIYDEFLGRADGVGISIQEYMAVCTYELWFKKIAKCTDLYFCDEDKHIIHNEDAYSMAKFYRIFSIYPDEIIFDLSGGDTLHGSTFSANEYLSFSINHIYNDKYEFSKCVPGYLIGRIILTCKNLTEVKKVLKEVDIIGSISINLVINKTNKMYSIEKVIDKCVVKEINSTFYRTNHIVHKELLDMVKKPRNVNTSLTRYEILSKRIKKVKSLKGALNLMLYYNGHIYESVFQGNRTRATVLFNKDEILFADRQGNLSENYMKILKNCKN